MEKHSQKKRGSISGESYLDRVLDKHVLNASEAVEMSRCQWHNDIILGDGVVAIGAHHIHQQLGQRAIAVQIAKFYLEQRPLYVDLEDRLAEAIHTRTE